MSIVHPPARLFAALALALAAAEPVGLPVFRKYSEEIPRLMAGHDLPGLAVAVTDERQLLWAEGFGFTDRDRRIPVTADTIFSVQSMSKTFTATAVLVAVQEGLLDLDEPITTYLPGFTVHSLFEEHPERRITLRHLLSHSAGFTHEAPVDNNFELGPVRFEDHVRSISDTWLRFPVGSGSAYSNVGISLAGYILQRASGRPFEQLMEEKLLLPLGMTGSTFDPACIRAARNRAVGQARPFPRVPLEIPLIPEGGLYASANDLARFIRFQLNQGTVGGRRVLRPDLLERMAEVQVPVRGAPAGYGLGVNRSRRNRDGAADIFWHGGGGYGFLSFMAWLPELKIGIAVLTNPVDHELHVDLALRLPAPCGRRPAADRPGGRPGRPAGAVDRRLAPGRAGADRHRVPRVAAPARLAEAPVPRPVRPSGRLRRIPRAARGRLAERLVAAARTEGALPDALRGHLAPAGLSRRVEPDRNQPGLRKENLWPMAGPACWRADLPRRGSPSPPPTGSWGWRKADGRRALVDRGGRPGDGRRRRLHGLRRRDVMVTHGFHGRPDAVGRPHRLLGGQGRDHPVLPPAGRRGGPARNIPPEQRQKLASMHPLGRLGTPEDVALAALYLVSDSSSWVTGITLPVAGGWV